MTTPTRKEIYELWKSGLSLSEIATRAGLRDHYVRDEARAALALESFPGLRNYEKKVLVAIGYLMMKGFEVTPPKPPKHMIPPSVRGQSVEGMPVSTRSINAIRAAGMNTVGEVADRIPWLRLTPGIGQKSYEDILTELRRLGLK